ncbi:pilus assembly protein PilZ [Alcanivorax sp. HI0083]|uniref:PilZ domain-containing protein n=1 Tax=unclassified Alcanivorax TaxID=2638842 RepID=UPI0007B8EA8A|nr:MULTISPECIES: PilZ domain-containing protein [unclassified Alcanivorax]KZY38921.1 pilus assembly protein PilZ [Alcanivorax sp. HI0044]KZZ24746.1 pilus assembly protein PilZ [Alcanivorax sp. HI0083]PHR67704.1 MAG: PilZ domain-containing protein [Alcanivorax sp.]
MATAMDNRRHPRISREESLSLTLLPAGSNSVAPEDRLYLTTHDISLAGISVELPAPIKPNTDVELWVALLENHGTYHLYGTIAWCAAPEGHLLAGVALDLERADGRLWAAHFDTSGYFSD